MHVKLFLMRQFYLMVSTYPELRTVVIPPMPPIMLMVMDTMKPWLVPLITAKIPKTMPKMQGWGGQNEQKGTRLFDRESVQRSLGNWRKLMISSYTLLMIFLIWASFLSYLSLEELGLSSIQGYQEEEQMEHIGWRQSVETVPGQRLQKKFSLQKKSWQTTFITHRECQKKNRLYLLLTIGRASCRVLWEEWRKLDWGEWRNKEEMHVHFVLPSTIILTKG